MGEWTWILGLWLGAQEAVHSFYDLIDGFYDGRFVVWLISWKLRENIVFNLRFVL